MISTILFYFSFPIPETLVPIPCFSAPDQLRVGRLEAPRHDAGRARAHGPPVEPDDGRDLLVGARDDDLACPVQLIAPEGLLLVSDPQLAAQLEHHAPGDAGEDEVAQRVGDEVPVEDGKHVCVGPLGDDAVADEDGLLGPFSLACCTAKTLPSRPMALMSHRDHRNSGTRMAPTPFSRISAEDGAWEMRIILVAGTGGSGKVCFRGATPRVTWK